MRGHSEHHFAAATNTGNCAENRGSSSMQCIVGTFQVSIPSQTGDVSLKHCPPPPLSQRCRCFRKIVHVDAHVVQSRSAALQVFAVQSNAGNGLITQRPSRSVLYRFFNSQMKTSRWVLLKIGWYCVWSNEANDSSGLFPFLLCPVSDRQHFAFPLNLAESGATICISTEAKRVYGPIDW